ncbi:hypothetical protein [Pedobacter miscanthi]|uniref:Uncharacterized protein n=1 Tax=Pedobacter miscanthi TaxID=2259170 RepID=A0A366KMU6_9SPHI|nr:hypothetical protein [Pedobacter miscanthi]RBQ02828.1 hypothetical protein DRW42_24570 [Pedobacter miscanthi]
MLQHSDTLIHSTKIDTTKILETRIVLDTLRLPSNQSLDLIGKVDTFYNNAWSKLIWFVATLVTLGVIVIPILIQWYQRRQLQLNKEELKTEIKKEFEETLLELKQKNQENLAELRTEMEILAKGIGANATAYIAMQAKRYEVATNSFANAVHALLYSNDLLNARIALSNWKKCLNAEGVTKNKILTYAKNMGGDYKKKVREIRELVVDNDIINSLNEIDAIFDALPEDNQEEK